MKRLVILAAVLAVGCGQAETRSQLEARLQSELAEQARLETRRGELVERLQSEEAREASVSAELSNSDKKLETLNEGLAAGAFAGVGPQMPFDNTGVTEVIQQTTASVKGIGASIKDIDARISKQNKKVAETKAALKM